MLVASHMLNIGWAAPLTSVDSKGLAVTLTFCLVLVEVIVVVFGGWLAVVLAAAILRRFKVSIHMREVITHDIPLEKLDGLS